MHYSPFNVVSFPRPSPPMTSLIGRTGSLRPHEALNLINPPQRASTNILKLAVIINYLSGSRLAKNSDITLTTARASVSSFPTYLLNFLTTCSFPNVRAII